MKAYLIQVDAWAGSTATPVRLASHDDDRLCHLDGQAWWPAIATLPTLRYDFFDGAFDASAITSPTGSFTAAIGAIPNLPALALHDARVRVWRGELGDAWGSFALIFDGRVKEQPAISDGIASFNIGTDDSWLDQPLLSTYAGTGGAEGSTDLQGQVKPLALGAPRFAPAVLVDAVDNIYQLSSYGAINAVPMAFDRLTRFGAAESNQASFAALKAAAVTRGRWATSLAGGYVKLGAPADGLLTFHVEGDTVGGWSRLPGALIARIAAIAGGTAKVASADITALNSARPWNLSLMVTAQTTARELIQRIAASVNAVAYVDWLGMLRVAAVGIGTPTLTMAADGSALPPVASVEQVAVAAPYWRLAQGAVQTWQVHSPSDIAYSAILNPRGAYDPAETYRDGDLVTLSDGSQWLFIGSIPATGSAPAEGNPNWQNVGGALAPVSSSGIPLAELVDELATKVDAKRTVFIRQTAPTAAESEPNDWWMQTDASGTVIATYERVAGSGRLSIGGNALTLGGSYITLSWRQVQDQRLIDALAAATEASNLADSKAVVFTMYSGSDPVPAGTDVGDILVRAYLNPTQMDYWNGSAWIPGSTFGATSEQAALLALTATNFNSRNDRLATTPVTPTIVATGAAVDHVINAGGSADISFEWNWSGSNSDIDGFEILVYSSTSASAYNPGATPANEQTYFMAAGKRAFILFGAEPTRYYTFAVRAYRIVDPDVNAAGIIQSPWVKPSIAEENPYRPASSVAFAGDVTGTISGQSAGVVASGASAANNGLNGDGTVKGGKVTTPSIQPNSIVVPYTMSAADLTVSAGSTVLEMPGFTTVGDGSGGTAIITFTASQRSNTDDSQIYYNMLVDTGSGYVGVASTYTGCRSDNGGVDTKLTVTLTYAVSAAQVRVAIYAQSQGYNRTGDAGTVNGSSFLVRQPRIVITGGKR